MANRTSPAEKNAVERGTLYLVATPIGNMADLSPRAQKILSQVDFVAAEDTRNSGLMLSRLNISKPMVSYHEHNRRERGPQIADRLQAGESCALVTDAGTPAISDPGEDLVRLCAERNIPVTAVPGCCAAVTALALSGLSTVRFAFEGFLPPSGRERTERLNELKSETRTVILYEAPHRLRDTLADLFGALGARDIAVCRELTKLNEEILRCPLDEAVRLYADREPRGEYVLVVAGLSREEERADYPEDIAAHVALLEDSGLSRMDAIKAAAKARGVKKNEIYNAISRKEE
jgi:16S rRNA (cytidine1402-2'-O)-methyltransferase